RENVLYFTTRQVAGGCTRRRAWSIGAAPPGLSYRTSSGHLCATVNHRYHSSDPADASNVMMLLPSVLRPHRFPCVMPLVTLAVTTVFFTVATGALAQERYRSPDKAVAALVDAMRSEALQRLMRVLGPGSDEIVLSGDPVDDAASRRRFLDAFNAKHQIVPDGEDQPAPGVGEEQSALMVGEEQWRLPIRRVRLNNPWRFDAQLARWEILYRRIGRNEMSAIDACEAYVAAQKEYAEKGFAGKGVYARRFISRAGER